ncbi:hypothetical protein [Chromobacterium sp. ATCC 53434]|uniref:hypothetical protein n=1 Tax=Chromobacterium sp. (strain ATCC 53434 / SC 14030) TaxID=2059672 RepID=UPI0013052541|nr:hypothetical protein [Chromobacterium sp. ATCC 53434]
MKVALSGGILMLCCKAVASAATMRPWQSGRDASISSGLQPFENELKIDRRRRGGPCQDAEAIHGRLRLIWHFRL